MTNVKTIVTGAVQAKISQNNLKSIPIIIPDFSTLNNLSSKLQPLFSVYRNNIEENRRLAELRDTLLPKLMSGELDVSDIELSEVSDA